MSRGLFCRDTVYSPGQQIDEYTVLRKIGEGRYGICYLVRDNEYKQYILKQLKGRMLKKSGAKASYEEELLSKINHEGIPRFIKRIHERDCYGLILELKKGNTFESVIFEEMHVFTRTEIYDIGLQIIDLLKYLHNMRIVHRDIRVPNTIYDKGRVYLVDFGLARWMDSGHYTADVDFAYFGDFLLHLYYTSFEIKERRGRPWYEELQLSEEELMLLKRLMGIEKKYESIDEVERDFLLIE